MGGKVAAQGHVQIAFACNAFGQDQLMGIGFHVVIAETLHRHHGHLRICRPDDQRARIDQQTVDTDGWWCPQSRFAFTTRYHNFLHWETLPKQIVRQFQRVDQRVNFFSCIVQPETRAAGCGEAEVIH